VERFGVLASPTASKGLSGLIGEGKGSGIANLVQSFLYLLLILAGDLMKNISNFMSPAALDGDLSIDEGESGEESWASVDKNEFERGAVEAAGIEVVKEIFPGELGFGRRLAEINNLLSAVGADAQSDQDGPFLGSQACFPFEDDAIQDQDFIVLGEVALMIGGHGCIELGRDAAHGGGAHPFPEDRKEGAADLPGGEAEGETEEDQAFHRTEPTAYVFQERSGAKGAGTGDVEFQVSQFGHQVPRKVSIAAIGDSLGLHGL